MGTGEKRAVLLTVGIVAICVTIIITVLFIALWQYKVLVGICLLIIFLVGTVSGSVVILRGNTSPSHVTLKQEGFLPYKQIPPHVR